MLDAEPTLAALTAAIDEAHQAFARVDMGGDTKVSFDKRTLEIIASQVPPRPEVVDARSVLDALRRAVSMYLAAWSTVKERPESWLPSYRRAFVALDRRCCFSLSLTTGAPSALAFSADEAAHTALVARADQAAVDGGGSPTELARLRRAVDVLWTKKPSAAVRPGSEASPEGVALAKAIADAEEAIVFITWARANP